MPRRARIAIAGVPWHIIQRGNNRSACFCHRSDYLVYLDLLAHYARDFGCQVHAYCLMTNHVHLLVTPSKKGAASLMMKHLGQHYVQYFNRTYSRTGTLWEGRFKSCITGERRYVLACYLYIELNPVRAGMVSHPSEYEWSSCCINSEDLRSELVTPHSIYLGLADSVKARLETYRALLEERVDEKALANIRSAVNGNFVLGSPEFQSKMALRLGRRASPGKPGRPRLDAD